MSSLEKVESSWKQTALGYLYIGKSSDNQLEKPSGFSESPSSFTVCYLTQLYFPTLFPTFPSAAASQHPPHSSQTFTASSDRQGAQTAATMNSSLLLCILSGSAEHNLWIECRCPSPVPCKRACPKPTGITCAPALNCSSQHQGHHWNPTAYDLKGLFLVCGPLSTAWVFSRPDNS